MTIRGNNFNSVASANDLLQFGYVEASGAGVDTVNHLPWNTRSWQLGKSSSGGGSLVCAAFPSSVSTARGKVCIQNFGWSNTYRALIFYDQNISAQISVTLNSTGGLNVCLGDAGAILATYDTALVTTAAYNIEAEVHIDNTSGYVKTYLNGVLLGTYTGNTKNTSYSNIRYFGTRIDNSGAYANIHDLIIDDAPTDTMIGNQYDMTPRPAATVSKSSDITTSDSTDPYVVLAHTSPGGTPYVQFPTAGDTLTVSFTPLPVNVASISSVSVTADWSKATDSSYGAGDVTSRLDFTVGSDTVTGTAQALANGFTGRTETLSKVMTLADVNAMTATITRTV